MSQHRYFGIQQWARHVTTGLHGARVINWGLMNEFLPRVRDNLSREFQLSVVLGNKRNICRHHYEQLEYRSDRKIRIGITSASERLIYRKWLNDKWRMCFWVFRMFNDKCVCTWSHRMFDRLMIMKITGLIKDTSDSGHIGSKKCGSEVSRHFRLILNDNKNLVHWGLQ